MSYPNIELQNRILEELKIKKQILLKQGVLKATHSTTTLASTTVSTSNTPTVTTAGDGSSMSANQRAALHNAHATSTGFFISTDSSFGNWILPVLPRFDAK